MNNISTKSTAIAAMVCLVGSTAQALPMVRISDGNTIISITDNFAGDGNAADGIIRFNGTFGGWEVGLIASSTKSLIVSPYWPDLKLDWTVTRLGSEVGTLRLEFTDTDFILRSMGLSLITSLGGILNEGGSANLRSYSDTGNQGFGKTTPLAALPFEYGTTGAALPLEQENFIAGGWPAQRLSLTMDMLLTAQPGTTTQGGAELKVPDGGSTFAMLGAALMVISTVVIRRKDSRQT